MIRGLGTGKKNGRREAPAACNDHHKDVNHATEVTNTLTSFDARRDASPHHG